MRSDNPDPVTDNWARFHSSDYTTDTTLHPKLTISYGAEITDPVPPQMFQEDGPARTIPLSGRGAGSVEHVSGPDHISTAQPFFGAGADSIHFMGLYTPSQVGSEGVLRRISFNRAIMTETGIYENVIISMAHTSATSLDPTAFTNNYQGFLIEVYKTANLFVNSSNHDSWVHFDLNGNFTYDSAYNLIIDIRWVGDDNQNINLESTNFADTRIIWESDTMPIASISRALVTRFLVDVVENAAAFEARDDGNYWPFCPGAQLSMRAQMLYDQSYINKSGYIDRLRFQAYISAEDWAVMENFTVRLAHSILSDLTTNFEDNRAGAWTTVLTSASYNMTAPTNPGWVEIDIDNTFLYNNVDNLLIDFMWNGGHYSGVSGFGGIVLTVDNAWSYYSRLASVDHTSVTGNRDFNLYNFQMIFADPPHLTWSATSSDPSMFTASVIPGTRDLVITPQPDQFGSGTVSLRLTNTVNGAVATQIVPIVINAVNDPPVLAQPPGITCVEDIPYIMNLAPYMSDIDDEIFTLTVTTGSSYATVSGVNITFLYPEGISNETVTITIRDPGGLSDSKTIQVTVTQINDEPYFTGFPAAATCDATVPKAISLSPHDEETATNDLLIYTSSQHINVTGRTLHLLYPKGIGSETVTVYLVDELIYGTRNNVSYTLEVTVIDHPEVISHAPTGNSVPIVSPVRMTFDAEMNRTRTENAFSMKFGTSPVNGTFSWNAAGTEMTFTPPGYMLAGVYDVNLASSAEDMGGVKMLGAHKWNFTVVYGDYDGDGMPDEWEIRHGLDPTVNDAAGDLDGDGMPNLYEFQNNLNPAVNDAHLDADGDGYTNLEEYLAGTDPNDPESAPSDFSWIIWVIIMAVIIAVALLAVMLMRKKPAAAPPEYPQGEYPPPPPPEQAYQEAEMPPEPLPPEEI